MLAKMNNNFHFQHIIQIVIYARYSGKEKGLEMSGDGDGGEVGGRMGGREKVNKIKQKYFNNKNNNLKIQKIKN